MQLMRFPLACAALCALTLTFGVACDGAKKTTDTTGDTKTTDKDKTKDGDKDASGSDFVAGSEAEFFTTALAADPETFDTAKMSGAPEGRLAFNLFEGLLMPGPTTEGLKDAKDLVVPGVAESYEVSADGMTYTFKIRANAKWSDGTALTAEDFVYSWKRILTPNFPADYGQMLWVIKGAKQYNEGSQTDWSQVGVVAPDPSKLVVTLEAPTPFFPELVAFYTFFPVPKHAIEKHGDDWTKPENIVSNGAYKLEKYMPQQEVLLTRSESYWGQADVKMEKVRLRIISDLNAVVNAYKTGALHWSGTNIPVAQLSTLLMHKDYVRHPLLGTYYYRVNVSKGGALAKPEVRQALSMAIDRDQLVNQTMKGLFIKATSYVPNSMPGFKSEYKLKTNAKKAKKILADAGYGPDKPLKVTLLYNTDENHKLIAEALQSMWKSSLGIDVELVNKEWKTYLQDIDTLNYEIARAGWIGDYNDPMTFLDMWVSGNGNNDTGWSNAEYDKLIAEAGQEADAAKRMAKLQAAEKLLLEQGPIIPIYWYTNNMLVSRFIEGFEPHNRDIHLFKYMSLPAAKK